MKRYWVFAGSSYYPLGGAYDLCSTAFKDKDEAIEYANSKIGDKTVETHTRRGGGVIDWVHVFDTETLNVVYLR